MIQSMTNQEIDDLAEEALNIAVAHIQKTIGQTDGGLAGIFFSDDLTKKLLKDYISQEIQLGHHKND